MGLQAPTSPTLFAFLIIYAAVGVTLLGLAGNMQATANTIYGDCQNTYNRSFSTNSSVCFNETSVNVTQAPGQLPCAETTAVNACGILWVWEAACAVAITAAAIAVAGSLVGLLWLVLVPQSDRTCAVLRGLVVFSEVAPIIFGGIAGVLLCVTAVQIVITNGYFGSTVIPFYVQTAVAASMAWLLTVLGFALCTPTARLGREDL